MPTVNGNQGSVKVGAAPGTAVAELKEWTMDIDLKLEDVSAFGDDWKTQTGTQRSWKGKATGFWDMSDTTGQKALQDAIMGGTSVNLTLATGDNHTYVGTAFVQAQSNKMPVGGVATVDFTFEGSGAPTYT